MCIFLILLFPDYFLYQGGYYHEIQFIYPNDKGVIA